MKLSLYPPAAVDPGDRAAVLTWLVPQCGGSTLPLEACLAEAGARARVDHTQRLLPEQALLTLAGYPGVPATALPAALCRFCADTGGVSRAPLACADPVHLRVAGDTVVLIDADALEIDDAEAAALVDAINALLVEDGLELIAGARERWYLAGLAAEALDSLPVSELSGRTLDAGMPEAAAAAPWRRLMCEVQMLLHHHPVNRARDAADRPSINALWCWGAAAMPPRVSVPRLRVYADDAFARGLCTQAHIELLSLADLRLDAPSLQAAGGHHLVVYDTTLGRAARFAGEGAAEDGETALLPSCWQALREAIDAGALSACFIDTGQGRILRLSPTQRGRLRRLVRRWRR